MGPKWFEELIRDSAFPITARDVTDAIHKALAGESLDERETGIVRAMLDRSEIDLIGADDPGIARQRRDDARAVHNAYFQGHDEMDEEAIRNTPFDEEGLVPGHHYAEDEYDPRMDGYARGLFEIMQRLHAVDPARAQSLLKACVETTMSDRDRARHAWALTVAASDPAVSHLSLRPLPDGVPNPQAYMVQRLVLWNAQRGRRPVIRTLALRDAATGRKPADGSGDPGDGRSRL